MTYIVMTHIAMAYSYGLAPDTLKMFCEDVRTMSSIKKAVSTFIRKVPPTASVPTLFLGATHCLGATTASVPTLLWRTCLCTCPRHTTAQLFEMPWSSHGQVQKCQRFVKSWFAIRHSRLTCYLLQLDKASLIRNNMNGGQHR